MLERFYAFNDCLFQELGWHNHTDMMSDIATLPQGVQRNMNEEAMNKCIAEQKTANQLGDDCVDNYSAEELSMIETMVMILLNYGCFWKMFYEACENYVTQ